METSALFYEPTTETIVEPTGTVDVERDVEVLDADPEAPELPSINLRLSAETTAHIQAAETMVAGARIVSGDPTGNHQREIAADAVVAHYPDLYDLITQTQQYKSVARASAEADHDTELVLALHYGGSEGDSEPTLDHVDLIVRSVAPPAASTDEAIEDLLDTEVQSATFMGAYVLTDQEIRINAGANEWIVTMPTEATTNDELQVLRLQALIVGLLEQGDGASLQTASAMEQESADGEPNFTFTTTTYSVVNGQVVFESVAVVYTLDEVIGLLEEGSEVAVQGVAGEALVLPDLYERRRELEIEAESVTDSEEPEVDEVVLHEEVVSEESVVQIITVPETATPIVETVQVVEETRLTRFVQVMQRTVQFFRHDEPLPPSPFQLVLEPRPREMVSALLIEQPNQLVEQRPAQQSDQKHSQQPAERRAEDRSVARSVQRPTIAVQYEAVTSERGSEQHRLVVSAAAEQPTATAKKRTRAVFKHSEEVVHVAADPAAVPSEARHEVVTAQSVVGVQRAESVRRETMVRRRVTPARERRTVVTQRRQERVVQRGKRMAAGSSAQDTLISSGGVTLIGSGGTPAHIVSRAFQYARTDYQTKQAPGPSTYFLKGDAVDGYQVICDDVVITVTEALHAA